MQRKDVLHRLPFVVPFTFTVRFPRRLWHVLGYWFYCCCQWILCCVSSSKSMVQYIQNQCCLPFVQWALIVSLPSYIGSFCYVQELAFQIPLYCFFLIHIYVFVCSSFLSRVWNMLSTTLVASMLFPRYMTFDSLVHSLVYKQSEVDWLTAHHKSWVKLYKYWPSDGYKMILNRNHLNRRANQASTDSGWMDFFGSHNRWYDELSNILFFPLTNLSILFKLISYYMILETVLNSDSWTFASRGTKVHIQSIMKFSCDDSVIEKIVSVINNYRFIINLQLIFISNINCFIDSLCYECQEESR